MKTPPSPSKTPNSRPFVSSSSRVMKCAPKTVTRGPVPFSRPATELSTNCSAQLIRKKGNKVPRKAIAASLPQGRARQSSRNPPEIASHKQIPKPPIVVRAATTLNGADPSTAILMAPKADHQITDKTSRNKKSSGWGLLMVWLTSTLRNTTTPIPPARLNCRQQVLHQATPPRQDGCVFDTTQRAES